MKTWQGLYAMIWIAFVEFLLAMTPVGDRRPLVIAHIVVGFGIIGLAFVNFRRLKETRVPARVKRIATSTFQLSVAMAVLGLLLAVRLGETWAIPVLGVTIYGVIAFIHVVNAFAVITQAAATAIAYDMWEDREFEQETEPGAVPPQPTATAPASTARP